MRAIQISSFGGPDVLEPTELSDPNAGEGEVIVDVALAGVNYADTHQAENSYLAQQTLPMIPGGEVAGTVGDRRVVAMVSNGGYASRVAVSERSLIDVPDGVRSPGLGVAGSGPDGMAPVEDLDPYGPG